MPPTASPHLGTSQRSRDSRSQCYLRRGVVGNFDLSVSSVTRNRADQPIRPSACARQCPERHIVPLWGVYANGTLVVLLLGSASRANAPQRNRDPNTF